MINRLDAMREADVARRVVSVPKQLFRLGVVGIVMEIGKQPGVLLEDNVGNRPDSVTVIAGKPGDFFSDVVDVDLSAFVQRSGFSKNLRRINAAVARRQT